MLDADAPESAALRAQIDDEIAQLQDRITHLRRRRNQLAPIMHLPADVLQLIMLNLVPSDHCSPKTWIQFTQVSHHWRTIALEYPLLWRMIDLSDMPSSWVAEFIERSRGAPLIIRLNANATPPADLGKTAGLVNNVADRISGFHCLPVGEYTQPSWNALLDSLDFSKSPCLDSLEVWFCKELYRKWRWKFRLRYLNLRFGCFNPNLFSPRLTELTLKDLDQESMPSVTGFYTILASLTNLRSMILRRVLTKLKAEPETEHAAGFPIFAAQTAISLPFLHRLHIFEETEQECTRFFSNIAIPNVRELFNSINKTTPTTLSLLSGVLTNVWNNTLIFHRICGNAQAPHLCLQLVIDGTYNAFRVLNPVADFCIETNISWVSGSGIQPFCDLIATLPQDQRVLSISTLRILWEHPSQDDFLSLTTELAKLAFIKTVRFSVYGMTKWCGVILKHITPSDCPNRCVQNSTTRHFPRESALQSPVSACASCQGYAASRFQNVGTLILRVDTFEEVDREALVEFLAHRVDSGRPLDSLVVECDEYGKQEGEARMEELCGLGTLIQCEMH
ncbi:hypothetical protein AX16_006856 [Volvariella volvacea WC 439]|nr:hypothetical protein AX16_006856 [Volvariella volvacea WC 439]